MREEIDDFSTVTCQPELECGKVAYPPYHTKSCPVTVRFGWWYHPHNGESHFSASGTIWNAHRTDTYRAGQCLDDIAELLPEDKLLQEVLDLWRHYHLKRWSKVGKAAKLRIQRAILAARRRALSCR